MKLHLGCGPKIIAGYMNIDARELPGVDRVSDARTLDGIACGSADLIYACHILEHVGRREYAGVLRRWFDVLKDPGALRLSVPDIGAVFAHYREFGDLEVLRGFLWGGQTYAQNYHVCGWDFRTLERDLLATGFSSVERYDWRSTEHADVDDYSQAYLPHLEKEQGRLMSLNVIAYKSRCTSCV